MTRKERIDTYTQIMLEADKAGDRPAIDAAERELCKRDLFYLLAYAIKFSTSIIRCSISLCKCCKNTS